MTNSDLVSSVQDLIEEASQVGALKAEIESLQTELQEARSQEDDLDPIIDMKAVMKMTNRSRPTIDRWVKQGKFPKRVSLPSCPEETIGWRKSDIQAWADSLESGLTQVRHYDKCEKK